MRAAPAVAVDLPGSRRWDVFCILTAALASAAFSAALCAHLLPDAMMSGLCIAVAAVGGVLLMRCFRPPGTGQLRWDGTCWWFRGPADGLSEQAGSVMVMMDWGRWMLLRFDAHTGTRAGRRVWLPVSESRVAQVAALRAAAYSRAVTEFS